MNASAAGPRPLEPGVRRPDGSRLKVVLHIGAFKTGTSYVQNVLWGGREVLAAQGVLFPGDDSWDDQVDAVRDRLGMRAVKPNQEGAWDRLAARVAGWEGTHAVISMEFLSFAARPRARRVVADLAPAEVQVVLTARDLARVVPASWQERVKNGRSWTWREFVESIQEEPPETQPGKGFWSQQDLAEIARRWTDAVGHDRVTLVTVPPPGSGASELLVRLGLAAGIDLSGPDPNPAWDNASLGAVETEALRRLNAVIGDEAREPAWARLVKRGLARERFEVPSQPLHLTADDVSWLRPAQHRVATALADGGWRVMGDLADLEPEPTQLASRPLDEVDEPAVSAALAQVAASIGRRYLATQEGRPGSRDRGNA